MKARRELDPETRRKLFVFIGLTYLGLIPLGLQLYFDYEHDAVGQIVMALIVITYFVALYVWRQRNGLTWLQLRRRRREARNRDAQ